VPEELLLKLIDGADQAPSGSSAQRACRVVVRDPAQKKRLADLNRKCVLPYIAPQREIPADQKQTRMFDALVWPSLLPQPPSAKVPHPGEQSLNSSLRIQNRSSSNRTPSTATQTTLEAKPH
jgi:hypothetical protein